MVRSSICIRAALRTTGRRHSGVTSTLESLAVFLMACWVAWMAARRVESATIPPSYIYGIDDSNIIWQVDPTPGLQTSGTVYNTSLSGQSNAFAFDRNRDQMFFLNVGTGSANNLHLWNKPLDTFQQIATGAQLGISGTAIPANAAYYGDAFWFFKERTNVLVQASLVYSGTAVGTVPTLGSLQTFTITPSPVIGGTSSGARNAFGDIAISPSGTLYAYTAGGQGGNFYSLDLGTANSGTVGGFSLISSGTIVSGTQPIGLQLSFNEDYSKLYGHNYNDGKWYEVNTTNGTLTYLNYLTTTNGTTGFRDIGGASINSAIDLVPEIDPTGFASVLALIGGGLGLFERRRKRA